MNFHADIWELHKDWCYENPVILYGLIRSMKPQVVVEVGTYRGFSASWMAQALKENGSGHLYCIDNFSLRDHEGRHGDARAHLESNLRAMEVRDYITLLDGDADKVQWPDRVDFAYVDGWHSYLAAKHDFNRCAALGAECICLDDAVQSVGPRMLVQEDIRNSGDWDVLNVQRDCGMAVCMRKIPLGPITFSQELRDNTGVDLQTLTHDQQAEHFTAASDQNEVYYGAIYRHVCTGKK